MRILKKEYIVEYCFILVFLFEILILNKYLFTLFVLIFYFLLRLIVGYLKTFSTKKMLKVYDSYNLFLAGFKGSGKDLSIQEYVVLKFKKKYDKIIKKLKKLYDKGDDSLISYLYDLSIKYDCEITGYVSSSMTFDEALKIYFYINPLYLSNLDYGYGCRLVSLAEFRLYRDKEMTVELTHNDFIMNEKDIYAKKVKSFEGKKLILSDGQLYFPSSQHSLLVKVYPSFPVFFQLSRQLYNMNIIINSQLFSLVWDKLRGQQDLYVSSINTTPKKESLFLKVHAYLPVLRNLFFTMLIVYDNVEAFERKIKPYRPNRGIKDRALIKADKDKFEAENGFVKKIVIVTNKKDIKYDDRYFHEVVFKEKVID